VLSAALAALAVILPAVFRLVGLGSKFLPLLLTGFCMGWATFIAVFVA